MHTSIFISHQQLWLNHIFLISLIISPENRVIFLPFCAFSKTRTYLTILWMPFAGRSQKNNILRPQKQDSVVRPNFVLRIFSGLIAIGIFAVVWQETRDANVENVCFCLAAEMFISPQLCYLENLFLERIVQLQSNDQNSTVGLFNLWFYLAACSLSYSRSTASRQAYYIYFAQTVLFCPL